MDVGLKSEGLVPLEQVVDHTGAVKFNPGDVIEVVIEREEPEGGYLVSYEQRPAPARVGRDREGRQRQDAGDRAPW